MVGFSKYSCMMAWRSRCTKGVSAVLRHNLVYCFNCCPSRNQSSLPRLFRGDRILIIELFNSLISCSLQFCYVFHYFLDVVEVMDFKNVCNFSSFIDLSFDRDVCIPFLLKFYTVCKKSDFFIDEKWEAVWIFRLLLSLKNLLFYVSFWNKISVLNAAVVCYYKRLL